MRILDLRASARTYLAMSLVRTVITGFFLLFPVVAVLVTLRYAFLFRLRGIDGYPGFWIASIALPSTLLLLSLLGLLWVSSRLPRRTGPWALACIGLVAAWRAWYHLESVVLVETSRLAAYVLQAPWELFTAAVFLEFAVLCLLAAFSSATVQDVVRDEPWSLRTLLSRVLSVPFSLSFATRGRTAAMVLIALGFIVSSLVVAGIIQVERIDQNATTAAAALCSRGDPAMLEQCLARGRVAAVQAEIVGPALLRPLALLAGVFLARFLIRSGKRRAIRTAAEATERDARPQILFLRSFVDDQVELADGRWTPARWLLNVGRGKIPLDHLLIEEFSVYGPVVALGRVTEHGREQFPPFGAARVYCARDDWRDEVRRRSDAASAIIMCVSGRDGAHTGVGWELTLLAQPELRAKTLFVVRPDAYATDVNAEAWSNVARLASFDSAPGAGAWLCHFADGSGQACWGKGRSFDRAEYLMALRWFFKARVSA